MQINLVSNETSPIRVQNKKGELLFNIAVAVRQNPTTSKFTVSFFVPAVHLNKTGLNLFIGDGNMDFIVNF